MLGITVNFSGVLRAFSSGRRTKNLYHNLFSTEQILDMKISELRNQLDLDKHTKNTKPALIDFILFSAFALYGLFFSIISLVLLPLIIFYTIYIKFKAK